MISGDRRREVEGLLARFREWAEGRPDIAAVGLAGSWAHGDARMDSDLDVMLVSEEPEFYVETDAWARELGGVRIVETRRWGPMMERRFVMPSGFEVEVGVGLPSWLDPADEGVRRTIEDGVSIIYDPKGLLAHSLNASGSSNGSPRFLFSGS